RFAPCGSSMARVLNVGRLLEALQPELARRLRAAGSSFAGALRIQTEIGAAALTITPDGVTVDDTDPSRASDPTTRGPQLDLPLPQSELARLALGVFPPGDLLARLERPPDEPTCRLVEA